MVKCKSIDFLSYKVCIYNCLFKECHNSGKEIVNTINPHSYCVAKQDSIFKEALQCSDVLIPDGIGVVWAIRFLTGVKIERIPGADLHGYLLNQLNQKGGKVFYLGSMQSTLNAIENRIQNEFPNIRFAGYSPPYKPEFSKKDNELIINAINKFSPDVLFVGMTAPKQEKWVYQHKNDINANIIASVGAVFDFFSGTKKRSSQFWIDIGFEWIPRFFREPRRIWKRVIVSIPEFIWDVIKEKYKKN